MGKLDRYVQKNETRPSSYATHKNKLEMDHRLKFRAEIIEVNIGSTISDIAHNIFSDLSQSRETK